MNALDVWLTIGLMTLATVITRSSLFLLGGAVKLPPRVIVVPDLVMTGGALNVSLMNPKLLAGIGAVVFFIATKRLLGTIVFGMALFTVLRLAL